MKEADINKPEDKALEMWEEFLPLARGLADSERVYNAHLCALKAVDYIMDVSPIEPNESIKYDDTYDEMVQASEFWAEVKKEITKQYENYEVSLTK